MKMKFASKLVAFAMALAMVLTVALPTVADAAAPKPTKLTLTAATQTMYVGQKVTIGVKSVTPSNANKAVTYKSSSTSIATVSSTGVVTAKKAGTATITVTSKVNTKIKATFKVTVQNAPTKITLNATAKTFVIGGDAKYAKAQITPSFTATTAYKGVKYSVYNTAIATVSSTGIVTAKKAGTTTLTVSSVANPKVKATCKITVVPAPTKVSLNLTSKELVVGGTASLAKVQITPSVTPTNATKTVSYTSSNTLVATVSSTGVVTAKKAGTTTITCASTVKPTVKTTCVITVKNAPTKITVNTTAKTLYSGAALKYAQFQLSPVFTPSTAEKTVKYVSSDPTVASVISTGTVTAKKPGTATISVISTVNGTVKATCKVTVLNGAPTTMQLSNTTKTLIVGGAAKDATFTLEASVKPWLAYQSKKYVSSNTAVATVSANGVVTAKKAGTAVITVSSTINPSCKATCTVTVENAVNPVDFVSVNGDYIKFSFDNKAVSHTVNATFRNKARTHTATQTEFREVVDMTADNIALATSEKDLAKSFQSGTLDRTIDDALSTAFVEGLKAEFGSVDVVKNSDGTKTITGYDENNQAVKTVTASLVKEDGKYNATVSDAAGRYLQLNDIKQSAVQNGYYTYTATAVDYTGSTSTVVAVVSEDGNKVTVSVGGTEFVKVVDEGNEGITSVTVNKVLYAKYAEKFDISFDIATVTGSNNY